MVKKSSLLKASIILLTVSIYVFQAGCSQFQPDTIEPETTPASEAFSNPAESVADTAEDNHAFYPSEADVSKAACINPDGQTMLTRFPEPEGYTRRTEPDASFAEFIRNYSLKPDQSPVLLYDGSNKRNQEAHAAVFAMHLEQEDFQQCADSVVRIYAEYLYQREAYSQISFHLVNGFKFDFETWRQGNRLLVNGSDTSWGSSTANDSSPASFEKYLHILFAYASTLSMEQESEFADLNNIQVGDIFIVGGSPGHVVMVADICENAQGETAFLLAQGYMPAQEFHILNNPQHEEAPWYYASELTYPLQTPEYSFPEGSLKRPPYLSGMTW